MAKKISKGLVALSSAAIVSVYGVGYALTQPAAVSMAAGQSAPSVSTSAAAATQDDPSSTAASPSTQPAAVSAASTAPRPSPSSSPASTGLKDGTYTGSGMSRHGGVTVKVTIKNGRITAAPITGTSTRYSPNVIAALPGEVVQSQSAQVDLVSGATDSSEAYMEAVSQALAQAGGASATTTNSNGQGGSVQVVGPNGPIYSNGGGRRGRGGYFGD